MFNFSISHPYFIIYFTMPPDFDCYLFINRCSLNALTQSTHINDLLYLCEITYLGHKYTY